MKVNKVVFVAAVVLLAIGASAGCEAAESPLIRWGKDAQSAILDPNELGEIRGIFPDWKISQSVWPSDKEIGSNSVEASAKHKRSCVHWLRRFVKKEYLPADLEQHLVAMNDWGLYRKRSEQRRLCDVFLARFAKNSRVVHIQESSYNVVIAVCDGGRGNGSEIDQRALVLSTAELILRDELNPDPNSKKVYSAEKVSQGRKISQFSWQPPSISVMGADGKTATSVRRGWEIGTRRIEADTDGRFVRFDIVKCVKGAAVFADPYVERFKPAKSKSGSPEAKEK
ncbi:MAG: hypothetical protein ACYTEX_25375 [Planctomycetota bacterium]|jgi:hypothetical protein